MRVKVTLTAYDLLAGDEQVLAEGPAILKGSELRYRETQEDAVHHITFTEEQVILERKAEISSVTTLRAAGRGVSTVKSLYGDMELETVTKRIKKSEREWLVEYQILSDREAVTHQVLKWKIDYLN